MVEHSFLFSNKSKLQGNKVYVNNTPYTTLMTMIRLYSSSQNSHTSVCSQPWCCLSQLLSFPWSQVNNKTHVLLTISWPAHLCQSKHLKLLKLGSLSKLYSDFSHCEATLFPLSIAFHPFTASHNLMFSLFWTELTNATGTNSAASPLTNHMLWDGVWTIKLTLAIQFLLHLSVC